MTEVHIPVYLQAQVDDARVGVARIAFVCDCSPNFCCCAPSDQKKTIQITIENSALAENMIENAELGILTGLGLSYMLVQVGRGNTSEQK